MKFDNRLILPVFLIICIIGVISSFYVVLSHSSVNPQFIMTMNESGKDIDTAYNEKTVQENFGVGLYNKPIHDANYSMRYSKKIQDNELFD